VSAISPDDLMVTAGYFHPRRELTGPDSVSEKYQWLHLGIPSPDHLSAGIAAKMGETSTAELAASWNNARRKQLSTGRRRFLFAHPAAFRGQTLDEMKVCGRGWTMVGDSAGLVDRSRRGLYIHFARGTVRGVLTWPTTLPLYATQLEEENFVGTEDRGPAVSQRFYTGKCFGESVLERMISLTSRTKTFAS